MPYTTFIRLIDGADYTLTMFHSLESFFQKHIEGFFDKTFGSGLQPVDMAKQLVRHMEQACGIGVSHIYVPNFYTVYLAGEDYDRLASYRQAIENELAVHMNEQISKRGFTLVGTSQVGLERDEKVKVGQMRIESRFIEELADPDHEGEVKQSDTQVFKPLVGLPLKRFFQLEGTLTVLEGLDAGHQIDFTVHRVNMGRRESNELPLTDMNTSRLHSYIVFEEGGHILYDAKSLNGTYVNHHRIARKRLKDGDRIKIGNTVLLYEVK